MVLWYVALGYLTMHLVCLVIAYYQGNKSLKYRIKNKLISNHERKTNARDVQRSSISSMNELDEEEEKLNDWKLSDLILLEQRKRNNIDSELLDAFEVNEFSKFESSQSYISWSLFVCILCSLSMSSCLGIICDWMYNIHIVNTDIDIDRNIDSASLFIVECAIYNLVIIWIIYRLWSSYIIYKYTHSLMRFCLNLFIDYELILSFYITIKVNKFKNERIIIPLSHIHIFQSSVISFWFILFVLIYLVLTHTHTHTQHAHIVYIMCIVFNYISMMTAFTMDDTNRLTHGIDLECVVVPSIRVSMSAAYLFRVLLRHIDIVFRLLIFYSIIISMGMIAFYIILCLECVYSLLNGYKWCEFHYALDIYHSLIASSLGLIHKEKPNANNNNTTHEQLRRSAATYVCLQRVLSHLVMIILVSCWMFISFECRYALCPSQKNRFAHIGLPLYIFLWIFLLIYGIFWTFPVNVLNSNVSFKMLKMNGSDIETFKDSMFYGILLPSNLRGVEFKMHPMQLYLFLTKQYDLEFIDLMLNGMIDANNCDYWNDNMLHNLCCNDGAPMHVINALYSKYAVSLDALNNQNLCAMHYYLQYNKHVDIAMIDIAISNETILSSVNRYCADNVFHMICKNKHAKKDVLQYVLTRLDADGDGDEAFISLCFSVNVMRETAFHCYLKFNAHLSKNIIYQFISIYSKHKQDRLITDYTDCWGNTLIHSICQNPHVSVSILTYFMSLMPLQSCLTKNDLNLRAIHYIECNHCYPQQLLHRLETMMNIAKSKEEYKEEYKEEKVEKEKEIETSREKQLRLLKQIWFYDGRCSKPSSEQLFVDFIELIDCVFNKFGQISWYQIRGMIRIRCDLSQHVLLHLLTNDLQNWRYSNMSYAALQRDDCKYVHLEYTSFHPSVNIHGWCKRRQIYLIPPSGVQFVLLSYRMSSKYLDSNCIPFRCYSSLNYIQQYKRVSYQIIFQNNLNSDHPRYCAKLDIPLLTTNPANIATNNGRYHLDLEKDEIIWNIDNVSQFEPMRFEFIINNIENKEILNEWLSVVKPVIAIQFKFIKTHLFSNFNIEKYTAIDQNENIKMLPIWKRKQAMNGTCLVQLT